ncbi:MAG: hypothetical protein KKC68_04745 [Candidatus Thermoplasmatota archaeon]|nr:hypothetical protein [Candidatus Thermoplasmatota archaeon]
MFPFLSSFNHQITRLNILGLIFNRNSSENDQEKTAGSDELLCRFVVDGSGNNIGETIAFDKDIVIIKAGARFLGVPLKHIEDQETTILVKGLIDYQKAYELGEKWRSAALEKND